MNFDQRQKAEQRIAKEIISLQYDDRKAFGIDNHFLVGVINEMVKQQADKIKSFADYIFKHSRDNSIKNYDDKHSLKCKVLKLTDELDVLVIDDETIYGPNLQHIIVIDDKANGKFHIRKLHNPSKELTKYKQRDYKVEADSFTSEGFIFTYEYSSAFTRRMLEHLNGKVSQQDLDMLADFKKIEEMGDNTFHLYECVEYSTSLMSGIKREIEQTIKHEKAISKKK
jgi:hypothetical protein